MNLKNKLIRILLILVFLSISFSQKVIAVSDILTDDLNQKETKQLFNALEGGLLDLRQYEVTSRQDVDKILAEQKFQNSGCTQQQCAAEIGKLLNADLMLLSEVTYDKKTGEIDLYLKLVDVETAKISTSINKYDNTKRFRDILSKIPDYLLELYRKDNTDISQPILSAQSNNKVLGSGKLEITSKPVGAKVLIDNKDRGLTPLTIDLEEGKKRVVLSFKGYERFTRAVNIIADSTIILNTEMLRLTGDLMIISKPIDADVYVNDEYKGKSPVKLQLLDIGDYFIRISAEGYITYETKYTVQYQIENILNKALDPLPASVAFFSIPDGAEVLIDNKKKGETSIVGLTLGVDSGERNVLMKLKGYSSQNKKITFQPGEITDVQMVLQKLPQGYSENKNAGWLSLTGVPQSAKVFLDGKEYSSPLTYHELNRGNNNLRINKKGYQEKNISFYIIPKQLTTLEYKLVPITRSKAILRSILIPGLGHYYAQSNSKGNLFFTLSFLAGFGAAYNGYDFLMGKTANYNTAKENYLSATDPLEIERLRSIYETTLDNKNLSFNLTMGFSSAYAIIWFWNIIDINSTVSNITDFNTELRLNEKGYLEASIEF